MTSPISIVEVPCPACGEPYSSQYRASFNMQLDHFDEEYMREMTTGTCPKCGHSVDLRSIEISKDGIFRFR